MSWAYKSLNIPLCGNVYINWLVAISSSLLPLLSSQLRAPQARGALVESAASRCSIVARLSRIRRNIPP